MKCCPRIASGGLRITMEGSPQQTDPQPTRQQYFKALSGYGSPWGALFSTRPACMVLADCKESAQHCKGHNTAKGRGTCHCSSCLLSLRICYLKKLLTTLCPRTQSLP